MHVRGGCSSHVSDISCSDFWSLCCADYYKAKAK